MPIKGSLKEAGLADVCQLLALGQKTGCLSVTDRARFGQIYFDRGWITYARVVNRRDRIGDLLVRDGALTQPQLNEVLELQSASGDKRLGELLVERGYVSRETLTRVVRFQIEEAIYHLLTWSRGSFFFESDQLPDAADILVSINPDSLLLEAARRVDEWSLIEKKIPSLDLIFVIDEDRAKESYADFSPEQQRIIALLDGRHTVQEIADETGLPEFEAGKALFGLIQAGFASRVGKREADQPAGKESDATEHRNLGVAFYRTAMFEDARREFQRVLQLNPSDLEARFHLALVSLREQRVREAVRELKSLLEESGPHFGAFVNLAVALRALGRPRDALLVLNEAEKLRPNTPVVALTRGIAQLEAGKIAEADAAFAEYRRRNGSRRKPSPLYFYYAALAAALGKRLNEAESITREGREEHPTSAPLLLLAGLIAERRADYVVAERWFRQAIEEDGSIVQAHKNLGDVAYRRGAYDQASSAYHRALELEPNIGDDTYAKLGNILYRNRSRDEALRYWGRALQLNPANKVVRNNIEIVQSAG